MSDSTNFDIIRTNLSKMTGDLPVRLTNDLLFKLLGQKDTFALKMLISSITHIDPDEIRLLKIRNPLILKDSLTDKEFILDIHVELNDNTLVDLEMQVVNYHDWPERTLQYLSRSYDSLNRGEDYLETRTAIHIGILDYILFPGESALLESYRLMNVKTHKIYSDKFQLYVLCLPKAEEPVDDDRLFHTDIWAKFFKARTWEDIKILAEKDKGVASAVETVYELEADDMIRQKALAREDYLRRQRTQVRKLARLEGQLSCAEKQLNTTQKKLNTTQEKLNTTQEKLSTIEEKLSTAEEKLSTTEEKLSTVEEKLSTAVEEAFAEKQRADSAEKELQELRRRLEMPK